MTPSKVLITGGSAAGGVASFAESLCAGFAVRRDDNGQAPNVG